MVFGCFDVGLTIPWECLPFLIRSQIGQDAHREREGVGGGWWWRGLGWGWVGWGDLAFCGDILIEILMDVDTRKEGSWAFTHVERERERE